jgi:hypothetical protein
MWMPAEIEVWAEATPAVQPRRLKARSMLRVVFIAYLAVSWIRA